MATAIEILKGTVFVETTGNDTTGDGTPSKPYKTIQAAITATKAFAYRRICIGIGEFTAPPLDFMYSGYTGSLGTPGGTRNFLGNTEIIGSGKPGFLNEDGTTDIATGNINNTSGVPSSYPNYSTQKVLALTGGTIIKGAFHIPIGDGVSNLLFKNFGVDVGNQYYGDNSGQTDPHYTGFGIGGGILILLSRILHFTEQM